MIETQEPAVRIIDKTGPLANPADRDHCLQYMTAVPLIFGRLTAADYEDRVASDPRIDALRVADGSQGECDLHRRVLRACQALYRQCRAGVFQGWQPHGAGAGRLPDWPSARRAEGMPLLVKKFEDSVRAHYASAQAQRILSCFADPRALEQNARG